MSDRHLPETLLVAYASGAADEALSLFAACHLTLCPHCRDRLAHLDAVGAALFSELPGRALSAGSLDAALARLDEPEPSPTPPPPAGGVLPAPLRRLVGPLDHVRWRFNTPGIWSVTLPIEGRVQSPKLFWLKPGLRLPLHTHDGTERLMVLTGSYIDEGVPHLRGDISVRTPDTVHSPLIGTEEPCVALVASDGPLLPQTFGGWLLSRFVQV